MRAFSVIESGSTMVVIINDERLIAPIRAFNYAWDDAGEDSSAKTDLILRQLDEFFRRLAIATASPPAGRKAATSARRKAGEDAEAESREELETAR